MEGFNSLSLILSEWKWPGWQVAWPSTSSVGSGLDIRMESDRHDPVCLSCSWEMLGNVFSFSTVDGSFLLHQMFFEEEAGWEEFVFLQMAGAVYVSGSFPWKD